MGKLEICCFNLESAKRAAKAGAHRIELCDNREAGGTTPPLEWLKQVKTRYFATPVNVMIRPRGGNFIYTEDEFQEMKNSTTTLKEYADGFVFGIINPDKTVDVARTRELVDLAAPKPCTFHKAFDETSGQLKALEDVISAGCRSILTSGGAQTASQGTSVLRMLSEKAKGRLDIIAGGSIRVDNLVHIRETTRAHWFHSSVLRDGSAVPDPADIKQMLETLDWVGTRARELSEGPTP